MGMMEWFASGGLFMWFVLFSALTGLVLMIAMVAGCNDKNRGMRLKIIVFFSLLPLIIGALGYYYGYTVLMSVVPQVDPSIKEEIFEEGMSYAMIPAVFGAIATFLLLVPGLVGLRFCKK